MKTPAELKYTTNDEWVRVEGDIATMGVTDYAQDQLGEIVFVELPETGDTFEKDDEFGSVESVKAVSEIYMPVAGEITAINEGLEDAPELVNESCYDDGWIIKVKPDDISQFEALLDKSAYIDMLKG